MTISVLNLQTQYFVDGLGSPLLFLHDEQTDSSIFSPLMDLFVQHVKLIRVDLPGCGGTQKPETPFTLMAYTEFLRLFLDAIQISECSLVGHGTGAYLALSLAGTLPTRVSKVILMNPTSVRTEPFIRPLIQPNSSMDNHSRKTQKKVKDNLSDSQKFITKKFLSTLIQKTVQPTLLLWGKDDPASSSTVYSMHKKLKHSRLLLMKDAGFFVFLEAPVEVTHAILSFLG
ncbi:MAG TPA: alpha/beta hydrolase [Patescibacteria group bacterium]|nr:alpha/beta hydrolase [Patescibacteria group bacterium]